MGERVALTSLNLHTRENEDELSVTIATQRTQIDCIGIANVIYFRDKRLMAGKLINESGPTGQIQIDYMFPSEEASPIQIGIVVELNPDVKTENIGCKLHVENQTFTGIPFIQKTKNDDNRSVQFSAWVSQNGNYTDTLLLPPNPELLEKMSFEVYEK